MEFQEALRNLTHRGILLAICSKNNPEDVLPILQNHPHMQLREEHFAAIRINWKNKAENIREIAEDLNIGLDTLVFMDDNPNERELISQLLPDVLTVDLPTDPAYYRETLEEMSDFELLALTDEDEARVAQYHAMHQRRAVQNSAASLEEYFHSLDIHAEIGLATSQSLNRLVQMFNKTNQFNLTTRKYQAADMERFLGAGEYRVYTLRIRDRFGDHGLVGAAIVRNEGGRWHIDSLLMSCRVMGLFVETAFLHAIYTDAVRAGAATLAGEFIPTKKNSPAADFYSRHGFAPTTENNEQQFWALDVAARDIQRPAWIHMTVAPQNHDD
jgi:FkbH-like protein